MPITQACLFSNSFHLPLPTVSNGLLTPVLARPVIIPLLENLCTAGVEHMQICMEHCDDNLYDLIGDGSRWGLTIDWYIGDRTGFADILYTTRQEHETDHWIVIHDDPIMPTSAISALLGCREGMRLASATEEQLYQYGWFTSTTQRLIEMCQDYPQNSLWSIPFTPILTANKVPYWRADKILTIQEEILQERWFANHIIAQQPVPGVLIGPRVHIDPSACLRPPCFIGADSYLGPGVCIGPNTTIGERCVIDDTTSLESVIVSNDTAIQSDLKERDCAISPGFIWRLDQPTATPIKTEKTRCAVPTRITSWGEQCMAAALLLITFPIALPLLATHLVQFTSYETCDKHFNPTHIPLFYTESPSVFIGIIAAFLNCWYVLLGKRRLIGMRCDRKKPWHILTSYQRKAIQDNGIGVFGPQQAQELHRWRSASFICQHSLLQLLAPTEGASDECTHRI